MLSPLSSLTRSVTEPDLESMAREVRPERSMPYSEFVWTEEITAHLAEHDISPDDFERVVLHPKRTGKSKSSGIRSLGVTPRMAATSWLSSKRSTSRRWCL